MTIPPHVQDAVAPYPSGHWDLLRLLAAVPDCLDLFDAAALSYCLAFARRFRMPVTESDPKTLTHLVRRPRRAILAWLGFPEQETVVRIVGRIPMQVLSVRLLRTLRMAMLASPDAVRLLGHVRPITPTVLEIVRSRVLREAVTPGVLQEVAEREDADAKLQVRLLRDTLDMASLLRARSVQVAAANSASRFRSCSDLKRRHDTLVEELALLRVRGRPFPPPPVQGNADFEPLGTPYELSREGRLQQNCVASYGRRIRQGRCYLYRVLRPERATLALVLRRGKWVLDDVRAKANRPVAPATLQAISCWLEGLPGTPGDDVPLPKSDG